MKAGQTMMQARFTEEQIIGVLNGAEAGVKTMCAGSDDLQLEG
jgi:hypothetical protein